MFEPLLVVVTTFLGASALTGVTRSIYHHMKPRLKGIIGEGSVNRILLRFALKEGVRLRDLLLPAKTNTAQIDNLLITRYGIFVIESKNYSGTVIGNSQDKMWRHILLGRAKREEQFLNPAIQNAGHVACLRTLLKDYPNLPYYPIVVFSNSCKLQGKTEDVVNKKNLSGAIKARCKGAPILSEQQVTEIKQTLLAANITDKQERNFHNMRASLSASAAKREDDAGLAKLYVQAKHAPTLFTEDFGEPSQEAPRERKLLTDEGAILSIKGRRDSIANFYEFSKRDHLGLPISAKAPFDHFICPYTGTSFPLKEARSFYRGLWAAYLKQNPDLIAYLEKLGPDRIRCASLKTETLLRAYIQDPVAFISEVSKSDWYQNILKMRNQKGSQKQALDKTISKTSSQIKECSQKAPQKTSSISPPEKESPSLNSQIERAATISQHTLQPTGRTHFDYTLNR